MQIIPKKEKQSIQEQAQQEMYDFFLFIQQRYCSKTSTTEQQETKAFSHHSANLIDWDSIRLKVTGKIVVYRDQSYPSGI